MRCPACSTECPAQSRYCLRCGVPFLSVVSQSCSRCGSALHDAARFCWSCGSPVPGTSVPASPEPAGTSGDQLSRSLHRLLPQQYIDKLVASRGAVDGERRVVTILFSDVKGSTAMAETLDPEEVLEIMNGAFEVLIEPITRHEGTLARLMGDAIMAFFGAPIAHEDDPARACRAALDIMEGIRAYATKLETERGVKGFNVRVGINTGLVVVAEVGADLRVEYTAMGDAVNLAARMETAAEPGTILLTGATQELVVDDFETEPIGALQLKGKAQPVEAFRLVRPRVGPGANRPGRGLRAPLVGRKPEINQLRSRLRALTGGEGGFVSLIGEAGLGKTRLMQEARHGFSQTTRWAEGRSYAYTEGMSYWTLRNLLYSLLGVRGGPDALAPGGAAGRSLFRAMKKSPEVAEYLSLVLGEGGSDKPETRLSDLPPEVLVPRVIHALREFLRVKSAEHPLVLVLDDLHWIDPSSLSVIESVLPLALECPVQFQFLFRPGSDRALAFHHRVKERFGEKHLAMSLTPLGPGESALLLDRLLGAQRVAPEMRRQLLDRTEGNPFFIEETVRQVLHDGSSGSAGYDQLALPNTLRGVIMTRIDSLPPLQRRVLQTASVLGRVFCRERLLELLEGRVDSPAAAESLGELVRREFVQAVDGEGGRPAGELFAFTHSMTHEIAHDSMLLAQRKDLHRRAALAIETAAGVNDDAFVEILAVHYETAGVKTKALAYLTRAAERANTVFAHQEAIRYYMRALALAEEADDDGPLRARVHEGLGDAYGASSKYSLALEQYASALRYARKGPLRATLHRKQGLIYERSGLLEEALRSFEEAMKHLGADLDLSETAHVYSGLGRVHYRKGEFAEAIELSTLALDLMEQEGDTWGIAHALNNLGIATSKTGDVALALEYHVRALQLWKQRGDTFGLAATHNNLGKIYHQKKDYRKALRHFRESIALCKQTGNRHGLASAYDNMSQTYAVEGRQRQANLYVGKAVEILSEIGSERSDYSPELWQHAETW